MEGDRDLKRLDVLVVEDQPRIRASLVELLEGSGRVRVVGAAATGEEALELLPEVAPEVILCDLGLPGIDGVEVTRRALRVAPTAQVLLFTVFEEEEQVLAAIQAGAAGYLLKGAPPEKIVEALEEVHAGGTVIQPTLARRLLRHLVPDPATREAPLPSPLSPREVEILHLIGKGLTNREAAEVLGLSRATVRTHLENIYQKLDVSNRVEAVTEGLRKGLIET